MESLTKIGPIKNGYHVKKLIGKGSSGVVYKATKEDKKYAIKFIEINSKNLDSAKEFYILDKLDNGNVLKVFEAFYLDSNFCVIMDYLKTNLRSLLQNKISFSNDQIFIWTKSLINGLDYLHEKKVIHRDIKPENILFNKELQLKIADFGMATIVDSVSLNSFKGTLGYISKEVLEGAKYSFKADIWSAGCVVFELIFLKKFCDFKNSKENENFSQEIPEKLAKLIKNMLIENQDERADSRFLIDLINNLENSAKSEKITFKELCEKKTLLKISTRLFPEFEYKFIGRTELMNRVQLILKEKQGVILSAFGGCGKSRLAHEIGKIFHEEKHIVRLLSSETKEKLQNDYNQLYREIFKLKDYNFNNKNFEEVVQDVKNEISFSDSKLLFIFDNVEEFEHLKEVIESLPDEKVKYIITTRNADLLSMGNQLRVKTDTQTVDLFNKQETKSYLEVNLDKREDLDEDFIDELIDIKLENNQILPLDLYLTASKEAVRYLVKYGLANKFNRNLKIHRLIQEEIKEYSQKNITSLDLNEKVIIQDLINIFIEKIDTIDGNSIVISDQADCDYNQIEKILKELKKTKSFEVEFNKIIRLKLKYANYSFYKVNFTKSKDEFSECYELLRRKSSLENKLHEISALHGLGRVYLEMDNLIKSLEYFQKSYNLIQNLAHDNEVIKMDFLAQYYYFFGVLYSKILKEEKAFKFHELSYNIRKEKNYQNFEIVDSLNAIAQYHENVDNLNEAILFRLKANQIAKIITLENHKIEYHPKLAETLENLSFIYEKLGNSKQEIENHLNAHNMRFKIYKYREVNEQMAKSYEYMANLNRKLNNKNQEVKFREKCIEIKLKLYEEINYEKNFIKSLRFLARNYEESKDFEKCVKCYEKICSILNKIDFKYEEEIIEIKYNMAMCSVLQNKLENAISTLDEILTNFKKYNYNKYYKLALVLLEKLKKDNKKQSNELYNFRNNIIVTGSWDRTIKIWNLESGECLKTLEGHDDQISCLIPLSYNLLASGAWNDVIKIWSIETGKCLKTLKGHSNFISCLLELSNKSLASASWDETIRIWDLNSGECLKILLGHSDWVLCLVQLTNITLASCSKDKTIKIWNIETSECLNTFEGHLGSVNCLKIVSNDLVASGSDDNTIKIWSIQSCECVKTLEGYSYTITGFTVISNCLLMSVSNDYTLKIWNLESGECLKVLAKQQDSILSWALLDNNLVAISSFKEIEIWKIETGECLKRFRAHSSLIGFMIALADSMLASVSDDSIKIWNVETGECLKTLKGHSDNISDIKILPYNLININEYLNDAARNIETAKCLTTLEGHSGTITSLELLETDFLLSGSNDKKIKLWNLDTGECLRTFSKDSLAFTSVVSFRNNLKIAYSSNNSINILNLETEECIKTLDGHLNQISCLVALSNNLLASGSRDKNIKIWDANTGECLKTLKGHKSDVTSLVKLSNNRFASGSSDPLINIWHVDTGECLRTLNINSYKIYYLISTSDGVLSCQRWDEENRTFDEDICKETLYRVEKKDFFSTCCLARLADNCLASGTTENVILIWDVEKGECLRKLKGHDFSITCLAVLRNNLLASGSSDSRIKIWNTDTCECLITLEGHLNEVKALVSLSNGLLASASQDATIKIWKFFSFLSFHHSFCRSFVFSISFYENSLYFGCDSNFFCYNEYNFYQVNFDFKFFVCAFLIFEINSLEHLALASSDHSIKIFTKNNHDFSFSYALLAHSDFVSCLAFISESNMLISGSDDQTIRFWELESQKCVYVIQAHESSVKCVLVSCNNNIISGSDDKTIRIWNSQSKEMLFNSDWSNSSHLDEVNCVINLPLKRFASGSLDRTIKIWNSLNGDLFHTIDNCGSVYSLLYLPMGYIVAGCERNIYVIEMSNDEILKKNVIIKILKGHNREVTCLALAKHNNYFVSASIDSSFIYWNLEYYQ